MEELLITFTNFSQRRETTCLAMPLVIYVCKVGSKHNPWDGTYLFTSACTEV